MFTIFLLHCAIIIPNQGGGGKKDPFTDGEIKYKEDEVDFPRGRKQMNGRAKKSRLVVVEREAVQSYSILMVYVSANWVFI